MILSASGWRKVFAESGNEEDSTIEIGDENSALVAIAANTYIDYIIKKTGMEQPVIVMGIDTRPTGPAIADVMMRVFAQRNIPVQYIGITAAPEIMAYSKTQSGFVYISASHNPIGHNGIKFGLGDGGVLPADEATLLADDFRVRCASEDAYENAVRMVLSANSEDTDWLYAECMAYKKAATTEYHKFAREVIANTKSFVQQNSMFSQIRQKAKASEIGIVVDMNGSARSLSIDKSFFEECGISYYSINDSPGQIVHGIIPEPENLVHCAAEMEKLHAEGHSEVILGYMPDCDGDRGNIVYWNEKTGKAEVLKAQEVFALSVLAELSFCAYMHTLLGSSEQKLAVAVNGPTSMRINEIAQAFGAKVYHAEVGEANVVNLARALRSNGYTVRILGEGSNGGTIVHPAAVRDPLNTVFAIIKLLMLRDQVMPDGRICKGMFRQWCEASGNEYHDDFTIPDILATLPAYTTTGVSEQRACLKIQTKNNSDLKKRFQPRFEASWKKNLPVFQKKYGIFSYEVISTNGIKETTDLKDFSLSANGGLKILFKDESGNPIAFIWMRGSGTEPIFRVLCDVKGDNPKLEKLLLEWETLMLLHADKDD